MSDPGEEVDAVPLTKLQRQIEGGRKGGRRSFKLTPERFDRIVQMIKAGSYANVAAAANGIDQASYYLWLKRGRAVAAIIDEHYTHAEIDEEGPNPFDATEVADNDWTCYRFYEAIRKADAEAEVYIVGQWVKQMPENWAACAAYLERRHYEHWGRKTGIDLTIGNAADADAQNDETLLAPGASAKVHDALREAAKGELEAGEPTTTWAQDPRADSVNEDDASG